ncbi:MAG TPA: ATP-binding protein [Candidatus Acidoferrales bacterium]|nr:ATP-binding protein [Candidatus Acidoferrales bacterium]
MALVSNPGFLVAAFLDCSAALALLVLYVLLAPGFHGRFFRYWLTGWMLYILAAALELSYIWNGSSAVRLLPACVSWLAAAFFFATVLECRGEREKLRHLWSLGLIGVLALFLISRSSLTVSLWCTCVSGSALLIASGALLWRSTLQRKGFGWKLLAGSLVVYGLHSLDRAAWGAESLALFRFSTHGLLGVTAGVAMAVVILEAGRARTEDLSEKLRGLALIAAEATHSPQLQETLDQVLKGLTSSLNATHGAIFLRTGQSAVSPFELRAAVGFSSRFASSSARLSAGDDWLRESLQKSPHVISRDAFGAAKTPAWLESEKLSAAVIVAVANKEKTIGLLCIASSVKRSFESDEVDFLVNVSNLLGLAVGNASLINEAATSKRQWLDTFNSIDELILVHSDEGRVSRANRSLAWHLGLEPDLVEGQLLRDLLRQGDARWIICPYCEGAAGKSEQVDPTFGGHFLVTNSGLHDSQGNRLGTVHVLKDFTERRQAESKYRALFEKVQEGVFIATPDGRFLDFNETFMHMLGYDNRQRLLQADIPSELYADPSERQKLQRLLQEFGEVAGFEFRFRRADGEIRIAHESSFVARDDSGAIVAYQGFILDVTDQKLAENEIRRRNRELLTLNVIADVLASPPKLQDALAHVVSKIAELFAADIVGIYILDEPAHALKPVAAVGYASEYARQQAPLLVPELLLQQVRQTHATLLSGSALAASDEFRELQREEGIVVSQVAVLWTKDRITGVLVIASRTMREFFAAELNLLAAVANQIAITIDKSQLLEETREAYESLRHTQEQLLQSEKMAAVGQLISGVAHELNNPLTAILGYSELLKSEENVAGRSAEYLDKLYKQAQRTHHIVQNLLSFARQRKPERGQAQMNRVVEDTLALREYDFRSNRIEVHCCLDPDLPEISADFHQLQQVVLNILNNAVDAILEAKRKGEIWVRTSVEAGNVRLSITDNGPGVSNPHRVFDPFYTTKPVGKGTGLGLSICYGIIKEHGGEIQVRNETPQGATFTVALPLNPFESTGSDNVHEAVPPKVKLGQKQGRW